MNLKHISLTFSLFIMTGLFRKAAGQTCTPACNDCTIEIDNTTNCDFNFAYGNPCGIQSSTFSTIPANTNNHNVPWQQCICIGDCCGCVDAIAIPGDPAHTVMPGSSPSGTSWLFPSYYSWAGVTCHGTQCAHGITVTLTYVGGGTCSPTHLLYTISCAP